MLPGPSRTPFIPLIPLNTPHTPDRPFSPPDSPPVAPLGSPMGQPDGSLTSPWQPSVITPGHPPGIVIPPLGTPFEHLDRLVVAS